MKPGDRLGPYEVLAKLGEGGMGEVYKARDTRLDRGVAIKVLPAELSADPERRARFEREASAIAALNHPHICTLHDIGTHDGTTYLVMEHLPGQTLADRLLKGPLPLAQALEVGAQIAEALDAAHKHGVIHRDLKPGNVMLTTGGSGRSGAMAAKLLDFGLAKLAAHGERPAIESQTQMPTQAAPVTAEGTILGTLQYMAPEQLEGKEADARTDLWALGAILYEMVTGKRAFEGTSAVSVMAAIVEREPPAMTSVQALTPPGLDRLVRKCLAKQADDRWDSAHDVADALRWIGADLQRPAPESDGQTLESARRARRRRWTRVGVGVTAAVVLLIAVAASLWFGRWLDRERDEPPGPPVPIFTSGGTAAYPTFSPEGDRIAFSWTGESRDNQDIYVRLIGAGDPQRLTTDPAVDSAPAWSPDGRFIAFSRRRGSPGPLLTRNDVYVVPAVGGTERRVSQVVIPSINLHSLGWSPDGRWLVTIDISDESGPRGLQLISVETGEKRRLTVPPQDTVGSGDGWGAFSPDGRWIAFVRKVALGDSDVYRLPLSGDYKPAGEPERLTFERREIYSPVWSTNGREILYSSGGWFASGRVVRRLDLSRPKSDGGYRTTQEPFGEDASQLAVAPRGDRLAYHREYTDTDIYRIGVPPGNVPVGEPQKLIASTRNELLPALSPDGRTIAFTSTQSGSQELWLCDADGTHQRQLTSMGSPLVSNSRWAPDGRTILFQSRKGVSMGLYVVAADGGTPRPLTEAMEPEAEGSWSRDGASVYFWSERTGRAEVYRVPAAGGQPVQVTRNGGSVALETFDRKWVFYSKNVAGRYELWRLPAAGGEEQQVDSGPITAYGLNFAVTNDGVYFLTTGRTLTFLDFENGKRATICRLGKPVGFGIDATPDGRSVLCTLSEGSLDDLILVEKFR